MNRKLSLDELNRLSVEEFKSVDKNKVIIILDNIRSKHNVGSVFRTADAFRVQKLILGGFTPCPPDRDIRKTAIGASETVDWQHVENVVEFVTQQQSLGYKIVVLEQTENSVSLELCELSIDDKLCLVLGNEVGGVDQQIIDTADLCIEIPQYGTKHSLNVSVCAGVVLWELNRNKIT